MHADRGSWLAHFYAMQLLHRKPLEGVDDERRAIARVSLEQVRRLARRALRAERCTLCCICSTPHTRESLAAVAAEKGMRYRGLALRWEEVVKPKAAPQAPR